MSLLNPENPDIAFARDCVLNTLADIPESYGAIFLIDEEQAYLAAMVRRNHERQREAVIHAHAEQLARRERRRARRAAKVVDLSGRAVA